MEVHKTIITKNEKKENITVSNNKIDLAKSLIKSSVNKPLQWHLTNLKNNDFNVIKNQVKYFLYKYRNYKYPLDNDYLVNIINTKIYFDQNEENNADIPFCYADCNYLYKEKNKIYKEKFIIFTCLFLLKIFSSTENLCVDATFKISPFPFYQTLIIIVN